MGWTSVRVKRERSDGLTGLKGATDAVLWVRGAVFADAEVDPQRGTAGG